MEQRRLGTTGLTVSCIGLGTAMWGRDTDEHEAADQLKAFVDAGGSLVDTADTYAAGDSERVLGMLLTKVVDRSDVVVASKAGGLLPAARPDGGRGEERSTGLTPIVCSRAPGTSIRGVEPMSMPQTSNECSLPSAQWTVRRAASRRSTRV